MTPERWKRIDHLVQAALARRPDERAPFLDETCAGDDELRREVESLIAHQLQAASFLESPALADHAHLVAAPHPELREGQAISHYRIIGKIGQGGMGQVYLAEDTQLSRKVALKLLDPETAGESHSRSRFLREARLAAQLDHANICAIHEVGEVDGQPFIAMQYIEGEMLKRVMKGRRLGLDSLLSISLQTLDALAAAHRRGIVHRDVTPGNIIVTPRGQVKVLDFGLAKEERPEGADLTQTGAVMGTPSYMSPEQARGKRADSRSDLFSMGVLMYEMATGRSPFKRGSQPETMNAVINEQPPAINELNPAIPPELARIIERTLSKEPRARYQTAEEMIQELRKVVEQSGGFSKLFSSSTPDGVIVPYVPLRSGRRLERARQLLGRARSRAALVAAAMMVVAAAVFFTLNSFKPATALTEKDTILIADFINTTGDAVFDGTLKQALAVHLGQSPFLNILSEERVREALRYMNRSPDERLTRELAREICQRQGIRAMLAGTIASLGAHYVITFEAVNAGTGDVLAREQVEAESKERVLGGLGGAASKLREKLGESLTTVERFDVPIEQATTPSLEALKAYSLGRENHGKGKYLEAMSLYKRAVELDPEFALAHSSLAAVYTNTGMFDLVAESARKAHELRGRVSEREKLIISSRYYTSVTGEFDRAIESLESWRQAYPRDPIPHTSLVQCYLTVGQPEKALEAAREALSLNPKQAALRVNLGIALRILNRLEEAKTVFEQTIEQGLESTRCRLHLFEIAFIQGDEEGMRRHVEWATGRPDEYWMVAFQALATAFKGQQRQARELYKRAIEMAESRNFKELAATYASFLAGTEAVYGDCRQMRAAVNRALEGVEYEARGFAGIALATCGDLARAQLVADDLAKRHPTDTRVQMTYLAPIRAVIEVERGNPARAIEILRPVIPYEAAGRKLPNYARAIAYLRMGAGREAAAEFQKILDNRGQDPLSPAYAMSPLGLARAQALTGDFVKSRKAYEDFFQQWKDADPDIPVLKQAKKEYAKLRQRESN